MTKYLVIGNSAGGVAAAEAIRSVDGAGAITLISEEPYPAYSRPRLTQFVAGECSEEALFLRPSSFWEKKHLQIRLKSQVKRLELNSHEVVLGRGERLKWDKLLLAAGALPLLPPEWGGKPRVYSFNSLDDAKSILKGLGERAVVIGAGLIGVSAAKALARKGLEVTLVARSLRVLSTLLDGEASEMAERALERGGVKVITNSQGEEIKQNGKLKVVLGTEQELPCDLVIVGRGVRPRLELVANTPIETEQGIRVNQYMETNIPEVYACGDVAEGYDPVSDSYRPNPNWPNAFMGGWAAGENMAGKKTPYLSLTMNSLDIFHLPIITAGLVTPGPGWDVLQRRADEVYRKLLLHNGKLKGMLLIGQLRGAGILFNLMRQGVEVEGFKSSLLAEDFGMAHLPPELRSRQLELAWRGK